MRSGTQEIWPNTPRNEEALPLREKPLAKFSLEPGTKAVRSHGKIFGWDQGLNEKFWDQESLNPCPPF